MQRWGTLCDYQWGRPSGAQRGCVATDSVGGKRTAFWRLHKGLRSASYTFHHYRFINRYEANEALSVPTRANKLNY